MNVCIIIKINNLINVVSLSKHSSTFPHLSFINVFAQPTNVAMTFTFLITVPTFGGQHERKQQHGCAFAWNVWLSQQHLQNDFKMERAAG